MCAMHMLLKTVTVCLRVADPNFIFDHICVCTIRTHMRHILPEDLSLALKQVFSFCLVSNITPLISGGDI